MDCFKGLFFVAMIVGVFSAPSQSGYGPPSQSLSQGMPYAFKWSVQDSKSGNDYGHGEKSDGGKVQGMYFVLLPDGRKQTVSYNVVGNSGYVADVKYEGEAKFGGHGNTGNRGGYQ